MPGIGVPWQPREMALPAHMSVDCWEAATNRRVNHDEPACIWEPRILDGVTYPPVGLVLSPDPIDRKHGSP